MTNDNFYNYRVNNLVSCNQPLIAISSVMRSGGNLLNRLFDGHSQLRTYHSELLFGVMSDFTVKNDALEISKFPLISNSSSYEDLFDQLSRNDPFINNAIESGWVKVNYDNPKPFYYDRQLHKKIFLSICGESKKIIARNILNNYVTGYFNSYIDYQGLYSNDKIYTSTYWPGFIMSNTNVDRFMAEYPDGFIISVIRNPLQWAGSAKKRRPKEFSLDYMDSLWSKSIRNSIKHSVNSNVILLDFDHLINNTQNVMAGLCNLISIKYSDSLIHPTFNSMPIEANSESKYC